MRLHPTLVWLGGAAVAVLVAAPSPRPPLRAPVLLDRRVADYLEDATPARPVAEVRAELLVDAGSPRLRLSISSLGVSVQPVPGLRGVQGSNLRTAQELHRLLRDDGLRLVSRHAAGGVAREAGVGVTRRETLPSRRIRADGTLDLNARTAAEWPVEVIFEAPMGEGHWHAYVMADDVPRLRVEVEVRGAVGRILALESLGENLQSSGLNPKSLVSVPARELQTQPTRSKP